MSWVCRLFEILRSCINAVTAFQEDDIETPYGNIHVAIQGDRSKQAILTFHDIGLNRKSFFFLLELYVFFVRKRYSKASSYEQD